MKTKSKKMKVPAAERGQKRTKYGISVVQFCSTWNSCETYREASEALGMPIDIMCARASFYRRKRIHLKELRRASKKIDAGQVKYLNQLLDQQAKTGKMPPLDLVQIPNCH